MHRKRDCVRRSVLRRLLLSFRRNDIVELGGGPRDNSVSSVPLCPQGAWRCGGSMHIVTRGRVHCFNHKNGACTNGRTADINDIEARVLSAVRNRLLAPEKVEAALQAAREELRQQISKELRERRQLENERQDLQRQIDRLVEWIATRDDVPQDTEAKLRASVARRAEIDTLLKAVPEAKLDLHPSAHLRFRQIVEELNMSSGCLATRNGRLAKNHTPSGAANGVH